MAVDNQLKYFWTHKDETKRHAHSHCNPIPQFITCTQLSASGIFTCCLLHSSSGASANYATPCPLIFFQQPAFHILLYLEKNERTHTQLTYCYYYWDDCCLIDDKRLVWIWLPFGSNMSNKSTSQREPHLLVRTKSLLCMENYQLPITTRVVGHRCGYFIFFLKKFSSGHPRRIGKNLIYANRIAWFVIIVKP